MINSLDENDKTIVFKLIEEYFDTKYTVSNPFEHFLIYKDKRIIGFINYSILYEKSELNYILVLPKYRNMGIASLLISKMLEELENKNVENVTLEVNENNKSAIKLYEKYGFRKVAIRKNYYGNTDGLLMEKELR